MSGPKYSTAYIREMQRLKQLERELAEQLENSKKKKVLADIERLEQERQKYFEDEIISECEKVIPEAELLIPSSKTLIQLKKVFAEIKKKQLEICDISGSSDELIRKYDALLSKTRKLKNSLLLMRDLKSQLATEGTIALQEANAKEFFAIEWTDTEEKILTIPKSLQDIYYEVLDLLSSSDNYEQSKAVIDETIMKVGDTEYKKRQLEFRKNAIMVEKNSRQNNVKMLSLINQLKSLYELLGWEVKKIPEEERALEQSIDEAKTILEQRQATKYIIECVHRVFTEKGYVLLEDCTLTSGNGQVQKDYFEFGEDALINVAMSEKGQILFEVVGDGTERGMDDSRAAKLESEMRRFCPDYAEIKEILKTQYGISLEEEHVCEPDKKYAKAVDVTDKKNRRRRKTEKKMMYYDD